MFPTFLVSILLCQRSAHRVIFQLAGFLTFSYLTFLSGFLTKLEGVSLYWWPDPLVPADEVRKGREGIRWCLVM